MKKKIVVTGIGITSSLGCDIPKFWSNLLSGQNAASKVTSFDTSNYPHHVGCEVRGFESEHITSSEKKIYGRASKFAIHAATEALKDAALNTSDEAIKERMGVVIGTTYGEAQLVERATSESVKGNKIDSLKQYSPNTLSVNIAKKFGLSGPNVVIPTACAAGNYAISYGALMIQLGMADMMVVGGADPFSHASFSGFSRLGAMSDGICRPFDKNRQGMLVGEGAGILILENYDHAKSRGSKIYAQVLSYGLSCDAHHMTIPSVDGVALMMENALEKAGVSYSDIDYVCAHGTGTPMNDKTESQAIQKLFYKRGNNVPTSSIKSMLGHSMGAASAIESIASVLTIKNGLIPPTINFETPDPECEIDCVPNEARQGNIRTVLNNSIAFGGNNACIVLARV